MVYNIKELTDRMIGVYKIDFPNGKIYIGISNDIKRRMKEHNYSPKAKTPCDLAIKKYGEVTSIDILELYTENDRDFLEKRETYWINFYDSANKEKGYNLTSGGDGSGRPNEENPVAVFTNSQVVDIRRRRFEGERKKDVYRDYQNFSFSTFEHVWLGRGYPNVGEQYRIEVNQKTRQEYSSEANRGLRNGRAKCSREEILEIRNRYDNGERICNIHKDFPQYARNTISRIAKRETFKDVE